MRHISHTCVYRASDVSAIRIVIRIAQNLPDLAYRVASRHAARARESSRLSRGELLEQEEGGINDSDQKDYTLLVLCNYIGCMRTHTFTLLRLFYSHFHIFIHIPCILRFTVYGSNEKRECVSFHLPSSHLW